MGKIAQRYGIRARKVGPETQKNLGEVGSVLYQEYRDALADEIYKRTPRPITHDLYNSVRIRFYGRSVQVGHDLQKAPHARIRRKMSGIGTYKGRSWDKTTQWDVTASKTAWPRIRVLTRGMHRRILRGD